MLLSLPIFGEKASRICRIGLIASIRAAFSDGNASEAPTSLSTAISRSETA
jgi:hypothetical protein